MGEVIKSALESFGYKVSWSRSAQSALDALDESLPDLVILELQLGVHNGIEFLYEMNSYQEWQGIPIIVHTINAKAQDQIFGVSLETLGVQAVLYKPRTTTKQLVSMVKQFTPVL